WFYKSKSGEIELFNLMGFHPETGDELEPVSKEVADLWKAQAADRKARDARRPPERVDPNTYAPFDPKTGEAGIWFHKSVSGDYEFTIAQGMTHKLEKCCYSSPGMCWTSGISPKPRRRKRGVTS